MWTDAKVIHRKRRLGVPGGHELFLARGKSVALCLHNGHQFPPASLRKRLYGVPTIGARGSGTSVAGVPNCAHWLVRGHLLRKARSCFGIKNRGSSLRSGKESFKLLEKLRLRDDRRQVPLRTSMM